MFGPRFARHVAGRYRRRGVDRTARRMVDWLATEGLDGATVLEIGGGVGEIQLELLERGAASTTNLELSPAYEGEATELAREHGVADRVDRRMGDVAVDSSVAAPADVVVLHRVVCCYPDAERLLTAAAGHARRSVVLSHPPRNAVSRAMLASQNVVMRVLGREYRTFAHAPMSMLATLRDNGFAARHLHRGLAWHIIVATREPSSAAGQPA
ncbi:methyltransferase domain-containing protein [Knoellia sp. CPCC 206450]|uniref:methyltransferase domain-containing protein n=1 Tax=Knoellia tibetensis TaxID=3404798 RepID=UPI003B432EEA